PSEREPLIPAKIPHDFLSISHDCRLPPTAADCPRLPPTAPDCRRLPPTAPDCRRPPPCVRRSRRRRHSSQSEFKNHVLVLWFRFTVLNH
ncbi:hypothetical protein LINPERHAP1_LOCUS24418, partial [Linum perenne]